MDAAVAAQVHQQTYDHRLVGLARKIGDGLFLALVENREIRLIQIGNEQALLGHSDRNHDLGDLGSELRGLLSQREYSGEDDDPTQRATEVHEKAYSIIPARPAGSEWLP